MTQPLTMFTIGFTRKSARTFFTLLKRAGVSALLDVRLNNSSQLAGYTKRDDVAFFCETLGIAYRHMTELAPTQAMLNRFKKGDDGWRRYEEEFLALMRERRIERLPRELFANACLLCAEPTAANCHRRLVAEYLQRTWPGLTIVHL